MRDASVSDTRHQEYAVTCASHMSGKAAILLPGLMPSVHIADQFQSVQLPETVEQVLDRGTATCAEFNAWGTLLAGRPGKVMQSNAEGGPL